MFEITYVALWVMVAFLLVLSLGLLAEVQRLREKGVSTIPTLRLNSKVPAFSAIDMRLSQKVPSDLVLGTGIRSIVFLSPHCSKCASLIKEVRQMSRDEASQLVMVCHGDEAGCKKALGSLSDVAHVLLDEDGAIGKSYGVESYPIAFVVRDGKVRGFARPRKAADLAQLHAAVPT
jgi:hypothetical protein